MSNGPGEYSDPDESPAIKKLRWDLDELRREFDAYREYISKMIEENYQH